MCCHASIASAVSTFSECPGCFVNFYNVISVEKQRHNKTKKKWRNCRRMLIEYQYTRLGLRHAAVATTASMMRAARGQRWQSRFLSREREREENWFIALGAHIIAYRMVRRCRDDSAKQHWLSQFHSIRASMSLCARLSFDLSEKGENAENTIFFLFHSLHQYPICSHKHTALVVIHKCIYVLMCVVYDWQYRFNMLFATTTTTTNTPMSMLLEFYKHRLGGRAYQKKKQK